LKKSNFYLENSSSLIQTGDKVFNKYMKQMRNGMKSFVNRPSSQLNQNKINFPKTKNYKKFLNKKKSRKLSYI